MDKSLDHAKFLIRNYLTNIVYYVIMKNRTKKTCLKNAPLLRNLALIVAGISGYKNYSLLFLIDKCQ